MAGTAARIAAALAVLLACAAPALAAPTTPLSQHGRWVTDAGGRVVMLHGVNMVYKVGSYAPVDAGFDEEDARFLRREGFNNVRLGVIWKGVEGQAPGVYDDAYLDKIERSVKALSSEGIFTMLDFHQDLYNERFQGEGAPDWAVQDDGLPAEPKVGFPGNYLVMPALWRAFDHFWNNDPGPGGVGLQDRYAAAWRHVAARFRREPFLLGYDLFNEPWPGSGWAACANPVGCPLFDQQKLTPFSQRAYDAIRQVDRRNIVWYEPNVIFNNGAETHHGDIGPRSGMSFHIYCLAEGGTPGPSPLDPAQEAGCETFEDLPFQNADEQSARTGDAVLLTEFGATDDLGQIERMVEHADRHMTGWQYWHYCECADPTTSGAGGTQSLVRDAQRPPEGDNVKTDKLAVLTRPYPQAVAGTPERFDFDRDSRRLEVEWSTARVGGGSFGPGGVTEIWVGSRHYPAGYQATVSGGEVVSAPGADVLRVRALRGSREVSVAVTPR